MNVKNPDLDLIRKILRGCGFYGFMIRFGFAPKNAKSVSETHVQYTQTDTIRQTDGPLVPMVRLVPIENDVIPMVLLVNVHLIKGT